MLGPMSRPKVTIENYDAVYDFYDIYKRNQFIQDVCRYYIADSFDPQISWQDGAASRFKEELADGRQFALVPNHIQLEDHPMMLSAVQKDRMARPLGRNT